MRSKADNEKAKKNIEVILEKMRKDTDLSLLKEYRGLFKKEISFFSRGWASAWLLMYYDKRETPQLSGGNKGFAEEKSAAEISLPDAEAKMLFVSIGKNRRLFPREIITLIMSKTTTAREDIGLIRILDNYSFVQVRDTRAEKIIEALNGIKFRGRTLTINYAKPKNNE